MKRNKRLIFVLLPLLIFSSCNKKHNQVGLDAYFENGLLDQNVQLTDVIVDDIFTPPVASRIYAYSNIAAYEGMRFMQEGRPSLAGQLNGLESLPEPNPNKTYYYPLVSAVAFFDTAEKLVFDLERIQQLSTNIQKDTDSIGIDKEIKKNSLELGKEIAQALVTYASKDGYNRRTALPQYSVNDDPGRWRPTPPDYAEAIEPHWNTLRPFILDSASQFDPGLPTEFSSDKESIFYKEAMEVYHTVMDQDPEKLAIAKFWDCNPNISYTRGHVMYFQQQISPGGHWIHIAAQTLKEGHTNNIENAAIMATTSIAIADAFISCWDQKYKSNLTRPETYINTFVDPDWKPILQTPAFPEHTSGHSVASSAAATVLTELIGQNHQFIDSTEVPYGLPPRKFESFFNAAEEAAISRLYGGIHYRPAIELGVEQGKAVGNHVLTQLNLVASKTDKITQR